MDQILEVSDLRVAYSGADVLQGLGFKVGTGQIVTLLGANGAGKTTAMHAVSGVLKPRGGSISLFGEDVTTISQSRRVRAGLVLVPEGRHVFGTMTVSENMELGAYVRSDRAGIAADREKALELFPRLRERLSQLAGTMSGGEQQMLAIARAMMSRPKLLLLDEPTLGLAPIVIEQIASAIGKLRDEGLSVLIVEQNASVALELADYGYLVEQGGITVEGPTAELKTNDRIIAAYLGGAGDE